MIQDSNFDSGGTNVDTQSIVLIVHNLPPFCWNNFLFIM